MFSLPSPFHAPAGRYGDRERRLRLGLFKPVRLISFVGVCLALWFLASSRGESHASSRLTRQAQLHLLIPATSTNQDLCKLLLSAQILGYPTPVLINYGAAEAENAYVQHLAKVEGTIKYLDHLDKSSEFDEDLILVIDGYDTWFQLPPQTLLKRYYALNAAADARTRATYGEKIASQNDMRQKVVFGPDKLCWPVDFRRPACWAVPNATLPEWAFGPQTGVDLERDHNQPRWLNSGTILSPPRELRDLLVAALDMINQNHITDSDQYYMAEVFGKQEFARLVHKPALLEQYRAVKYEWELIHMQDTIRWDAPMTTGKTEYHIGIDYESSMFQTFAFWKQYLTWMRPSDSWRGMKSADPSVPSQYDFNLPNDAAHGRNLDTSLWQRFTSGVDKEFLFENVELLYNTVTKQAPVIMHFTGEKHFRQLWWQRLWFQSNAGELREASLRIPQNTSLGEIAGYTWYNAQLSRAADSETQNFDGAWSDNGDWVSWNTLCSAHEQVLYHVPSDDFFHPPPRTATREVVVPVAKATMPTLADGTIPGPPGRPLRLEDEAKRLEEAAEKMRENRLPHIPG